LKLAEHDVLHSLDARDIPVVVARLASARFVAIPLAIDRRPTAALVAAIV
jgi:hypothetical protein